MGMKIKLFVCGRLGTNAWLVYDEESREAMLVDPAAYTKEMEKEILSEGLQLKYIALTHGHADHIEGTQDIKSAFPDTRAAVGKGDAAMLGDPALNLSDDFFGVRIAFEPDILLAEGDVLSLGDLSFRVIETPGHTRGGISFYTENSDPGLMSRAFSGTLFCGDTLFQSSFGRTDLPGGDMRALMASIREKLYALPDDTLVLPGHMDVTSIGHEKLYNVYVKSY